MESLGSPFQETLDARTAFVRKITVTATRGDETAELVPLGGSLTQDARRSLRWNGTLQVPVEGDLIPTVPGDLLTPFGTTVTVTLGVELADGSSSEVGYGVYDLEKSRVALSADSRVVDLQLVDLGQLLARYRFERPFTVAAGTDLAEAVRLVVVNRLGISTTLDTTGITLGLKRVFGLEPSVDPARELIELVEGFGFRLWFDREGVLQLDQPPVADPGDAVPYQGRITVAGAWDNKPPNVIVARGESTTGTPVQAVAIDDDSNSPTFAGSGPGTSPYGRVTEYFVSPLLTTTNMATAAANSRLARRAAQGAAWDVSKAWDPSIDCDDVLDVPLDADTNLPLFVQAVTLNINGDTVANCRAISNLSDDT